MAMLFNWPDTLIAVENWMPITSRNEAARAPKGTRAHYFTNEFSGAIHHAHHRHANRRKMTRVDTSRKPDSNMDRNMVGYNSKSVPARFEHTSPSAQPLPLKLGHCWQSRLLVVTRPLAMWLQPLQVLVGSTSLTQRHRTRPLAADK
jgi:hypothetical protein